MCAPKCRISTKVINCKLCREVKVNCWTMKTCWPKMLDLQESVFLILGLSAGSILIGFVTLIFESGKIPFIDQRSITLPLVTGTVDLLGTSYHTHHLTYDFLGLICSLISSIFLFKLPRQIAQLTGKDGERS